MDGEHWWNDYEMGKPKCFGKNNLDPMSLYPPHILHDSLILLGDLKIPISR
jgi:hypothetical protein